jgi:hypothetical protein
MDGLYWIESMVCSHCYARMQRQRYEVSCFGKPTQIDFRTGKKKLGFDPTCEECQRICPDRVPCAKVFEL